MPNLPLFVAEVSSNHNRDIDRCYQFIDTAAAIGCFAVKFQLFRIDELFAPEILAKSAVHRQRKEWELPIEFIPRLAERCRERGVQFSCTPFYIEAVWELLPFVDFYKIASYELLWHDLLSACARTGKPVVLSTGMANNEEIAGAVKALSSSGCSDITLLHCVSGYPAPAKECNLAAIQTLAQTFDCPTGWSDHSRSSAVLYRAVHRWGAGVIEFHLDLEGKGEEFVSGHCWLPEEIKKVIESINLGFTADGSGEKSPSPAEEPDRMWRADPEDGLRPLKRIRREYNP
ncbi:MAG: N-acetylneuraminate synthase family protein [Geobacter sp.]|nr:N-acetylneuraminate synthase family protein [Geobacter sp.]